MTSEANSTRKRDGIALWVEMPSEKKKTADAKQYIERSS